MEIKSFILIIIFFFNLSFSFSQIFEQLTDNLPIYPFGSIIINPDKKIPNNIFCSVNSDLYFSSDNGSHWKIVESFSKYGSGVLSSTFISYPHILVIVDSWNMLFISNDYGESWREIDSMCFLSKSNYVKCALTFSSVVIDNGRFYASTNRGVFYSEDEGNNWVFTGNTESPFSMSWILTKGDTLLACSHGGSASGFYFSSNHGKTWEQRSKGTTDSREFFQFTRFNDLLFIKDNLFKYKYFITKNYGEEWSLLFEYDPETLDDIIIQQGCGRNLFAIGRNGVAISNDTGKTWVKYTDGLPYYNSKDRYNLTFFSMNDEYIFVISTSRVTGSKFFRAKISNCEFVKTDVKENPVFEGFSISPNLAGDYIEITGTNPRIYRSDNEQIRIYNALGECTISTRGVVTSPQRINVSGLPPGVYFVRLGDYTGKFVKM